ncbi:uncharacterized protein H6S33_004872 [Morchella sextelata]|uniref:uncharacterized protein n=1 Tax=Morchella sextelata TaxID=1174677 RepID=UPI001D0513F7|nr:uncharacterized protein H6S33_004872 [Morchella sextelata]KAH0605650.1 hypothetical protein H6S33_004872 [Morchella sextelata]
MSFNEKTGPPPSMADTLKETIEDRKSDFGSRPDTTATTPVNGSVNELTTVRTETVHDKPEEDPTAGEHLKEPEHPVMDLANGIVAWDGQDDPLNPKNFPSKLKWTILALVSSITLVSPLASSMFAPGVGFMNKEFGNTSTILSSFVVSVFVLGYAVGPLLLSPLSEIYGRGPVLNYANAFFVVWQIGCALAPNLNSLIVFRFFSGIGGSGCLTIGGGVISDLFPAEQRGKATAIYAMGPLFGPVIGPICGGFIAQRVGWRWVYWVLLIVSGLVTALIWVFNRESNPRVLLARKTAALKKETGNEGLVSWYDREHVGPPLSPIAVLTHGLMRPLKLLIMSPIVALLSLYMSITYGLLYLLFTTITSVFQGQYGWEPDMTGLAYLGIGIGLFLGVGAVAKISDATVIKLAKRNGGVPEPEMRLPSCMIFGMFLPISLFWYGWVTEKHVHWIVAIISMIPFGFGMMGIFIPVQTYLIDAFPEYAASVIASLTATRSLFGAFLPMAGPSMYGKLGLGWGNTLLGFLGLILVPFLPFIYKYGKTIRTKWPVDLR